MTQSWFCPWDFVFVHFRLLFLEEMQEMNSLVSAMLLLFRKRKVWKFPHFTNMYKSFWVPGGQDNGGGTVSFRYAWKYLYEYSGQVWPYDENLNEKKWKWKSNYLNVSWKCFVSLKCFPEWWKWSREYFRAAFDIAFLLRIDACRTLSEFTGKFPLIFKKMLLKRTARIIGWRCIEVEP